MTVQKRVVLYLSGFDPRGARWYHQTYRDEAAEQAAVSGYAITVGKRERVGEHLLRWDVAWEQNGTRVETDYLYGEWDDIVRHFWVRQPVRLAWYTLTASWRALRTGVFANTFRWSWPAGVTATMPAILILLLLLSTLLLAWLGGALFGWAGALGGLLLGIAGLWVAYRLEQKFNLTWVGRILSFHEREEQSRAGMLDKRRKAFGTLVADYLAGSDADEILVSGHSYGAVLAISVVAEALAATPERERKVSLLTLGQTIMWLAWLPNASRMRADIATVAESGRVDWIDVSAPPDGACFALVDPYTAIGDRRTDRANPKLINAKFHEIMPPEKFARRTRDWMELHFQYIMATARPSDYDYFAITAGPETLAERFARRPSIRDFTRLRRGATRALR